MKTVASCLSLTLALIVWSSSLSAAGLMPLLHAPECKQYRYPVMVSSESGKHLSGPTGNLFCTGQDFGSPLRDRSSAVAALAVALEGKVIKELVLSSYLYAEPEFGAFVCSQKFDGNAEITVLAQRTGDMAGRVSHDVAVAFNSCAVTPRYIYFGCDVFDEENQISTGERCPRGRVNVLHLKSAQFKLTDQTAVVLLGSGNFNRSLYANVEDWTLYSGVVGDPFLVQAECAAKAIVSSSGMGASTQVIKDHMDSCLSSWPTKEAALSGYRLEFAPLQGDAFRTRLIDALSTGDAIDIAAQAFEDPQLVAAALGNKAATIRIIADDDWYWALRAKAPMHTANYEKLKWVEKLPKDAVRYLLTNHSKAGGVGSTMHTRIVSVTKSGVRTIFTGSAHFRQGSLTGNIEHLLTITEPSITSKYSAFLDDLWKRAVPWQDMPLVDPPIVLPKTPEPK